MIDDFDRFSWFSSLFLDWEFCLLLTKENNINEKSLRNLKQYKIQKT